MGSRTRFWKDGWSSCLRASGAVENASMTASDFETPVASLVNTPMAVRERKIAAKIPAIPIPSRTVTVSDLQLDHAGHHEGAEPHHQAHHAEEQPADGS